LPEIFIAVMNGELAIAQNFPKFYLIYTCKLASRAEINLVLLKQQNSNLQLEISFRNMRHFQKFIGND